MNTRQENDSERRLLADIKEFLTSQGFKTRGNTYTRRVNDVVQMFNYQRSMSGTVKRRIVTINVGIFSRTVARALGNPELSYDVAECHWRQRLGRFAALPADRWWTVEAGKDAEPSVREIIDLIREFALPALAVLDSTNKLAELWESGHSHNLSREGAAFYLKTFRDYQRSQDYPP